MLRGREISAREVIGAHTERIEAVDPFVNVAWSSDLGLPVEPAVRAALASARGVLADLGCQVRDAAPDLSGGDEVFRTWRALRFATAFGSLLRDHPGDVGPNVTWNVERGQELTVADLVPDLGHRAARDLGTRRIHPPAASLL